jgi:RNA polymerase sigma factor (sigma-70 family)
MAAFFFDSSDDLVSPRPAGEKCAAIGKSRIGCAGSVHYGKRFDWDLEARTCPLVSGRGVIVRQFQTLFGLRALASLGDAELLERFLARDDDESASFAFEALVVRHGPMVLRVCRSILRDDNDVDDAFQAAFLVLVKRARSVRRRDSLASWLYGVALRVASAARVASARRRVFERRGAEMTTRTTSSGASHPWGGADLGPLLRDEIERLPERFRATVILCHLDGLTHEEAAQLLQLPVGTVRSRLARAREKLRGRLARRGLAPSEPAALFAVAPLILPATLIRSTTTAALRIAAGEALTAGAVSAAAASLTGGVLRTMLMAKWKMGVASLCLASATVVIGAGISHSAFVGERDRPSQIPTNVAQAADRSSAEDPVDDGKSDKASNRVSSETASCAVDPCPASEGCVVRRTAVAMFSGVRATVSRISAGFSSAH